MSKYGASGKPNPDFWSEWVFGRCGMMTPLATGTIVGFSIVAFLFSLWAWQTSQYAGQQVVYYQSAAIVPSPFGIVLAGAVPMTMTLPNNLLEFIGGLYSVACASPAGHVIKITPGILNTRWIANATMAMCQPGYPNAGFLFHVLSQSSVRVMASDGVTFV